YDEMSNVLEYALGKSPMSSDTSGITLQRDGTIVKMNYTRLSQATDITMHAYWTSDLTDPNSWSRTQVTETMLSDDGVIQSWQATLPSDLGKVFMRLIVTKP